jgi:hypothetical protein
MTKEQMKTKAVELMKGLNIHSDYIRSFKSKTQRICVFRNFGGYYIDEGSDLDIKIKNFESNTGDIVYAVVYDEAWGCDLYYFLYVTSDEENHGYNHIERFYGGFIVNNVCLYNKTYDNLEYMETPFESWGGGIKFFDM